MPSPSAAEQLDVHNPQFTADRFMLLAQMRAEASVTFLPVLQVYAVTRWHAIRFPDMRLVPDAIVPEIPHYNLRAPITLPVLLK